MIVVSRCWSQFRRGLGRLLRRWCALDSHYVEFALEALDRAIRDAFEHEGRAFGAEAAHASAKCVPVEVDHVFGRTSRTAAFETIHFGRPALPPSFSAPGLEKCADFRALK